MKDLTITVAAVILLIVTFVFVYVMFPPETVEEEIELTPQEEIEERREASISEMDQRFFDRGQCSSIRNRDLRNECNELHS